MFRNLCLLGRTLASGKSVFELSLDGLKETYTIALTLKFSKDGTRFLKCETRELSPSERESISYKQGPSNGFDPLPVTRFSGESVKVIYRMRRGLEGALSSVGADLAGTLGNLVKTFEKESQELERGLDLAQKGAKLRPDRRAVVLIETDHPLHEHPDWKPRVLSWLIWSYGTRDGEECARRDAPCSLCGITREKVYGNFNEIKVYNLDKPGSIAGGCTVDAAVHNFPVCRDCAAFTNHGFARVNSDLRFKMGGLDYILLPMVKLERDRQEILDLIVSTRANRAPSLVEKKLKNLTGAEFDMLDFAGRPDTLSFQLVFFRVSKAEWRVLAEVAEVLPSRLMWIKEAKREAEKFNQRDAVTIFALRDFAPSKSTLLSWISAILEGGRREYPVVLRAMVDRILAAYRKPKGLHLRALVLRAYMVMDFLSRLDVIELGRGQCMAKSGSSPIENFLAEHGDFFNRVEKRIAFLSGCLANDIASLQRKRVGSEPFIKKICGMRLDRERLKKLLSEGTLTLIQYGSSGLSAETKKLLCDAWTDAGDSWNISDDETTFCFTLGLNLNSQVKGEEVA